jgi:hypothetical protein
MSSCGYIYLASDVTSTSADLLKKRAARIRQHAWHFVDDPIAERLEEYADELEALATRSAGTRPLGPLLPLVSSGA